MEDIIRSLNRAFISQGWAYGEKLHRIGNPFSWVDADQLSKVEVVHGPQAFLQYLTMFFEQYPTPERIRTDDYDEMLRTIEECLSKAYRHFVPFPSDMEDDFKKSVTCNAVVRAQDYCALRSFCGGISSPINHLDIGPGLGTHAVYSRKGFDSNFYALEASPHSYSIQRDFFRFLSGGEAIYLDVVECENFNLSESSIKALVNKHPEYRLKHIPSWHFGIVESGSIDLITATWVLNEINSAGILWLMSQTSRVLRKGGYLYIRDSSKLKPLRHSINYDKLLPKIGFAEVGRLRARNRVDLHGIPRAYQKIKDCESSFEELVNLCLGKFAVTTHGGGYVQNMPRSQGDKVV
ncbi:MAG: hypothetical protein ABID09_04575 [Candidatus Omnitrophota bacterium]